MQQIPTVRKLDLFKEVDRRTTGKCRPTERDAVTVPPVGLEQGQIASGETTAPWSHKDHSVTELRVSVTSDRQNECLDRKLILETNSGSTQFPSQDLRQLALSVHDDYLREFIDEAVQEREPCSMELETLHHWTVAKSLSLNFVGHQDTFELIREYIVGETVQPFVVVGDNGSGKSTVIAEAALYARQHLSSVEKRIQSTVMIRFCGRTYESQRSPRLISSLAEEFLSAADREPTRLSPWHQEAKRLLGNVFRNGDYKGLLVVFIDAIDELGSDEDLDDFLDWLPARIANNVKVIVSCKSEGRTLERLRQKVTNQTNIIQLDKVSVEHCIQLLSSLQERTERKLSTEQRALFEHAILHCQLPLYVKLLHDILSSRSFFLDSPKGVLESTAEQCAVYKFKSLEETHGRSLTSNALGFLVVEPDGLSDFEMEDLLSHNDDVVKETFTAGDLPSMSGCRSIPWIKFRDELVCYLSFENSGGSGVVRFAHRCLARVAETRYARSPSSKTSLHSQIADYFLSGTAGPALLEMATWDRKERNSQDKELHFKKDSESSRPNYRKLDLLPIHLHRSGRFRDLFGIVCFNFEWIYAKLVARSTHEILIDFRMVRRDIEVNLVAEAIELSERTLAREPRLLGVELKGRLWGYYATHDRIRSLLDQCDLWAMTLCSPLMPMRTTFAAAGTPLQKIVSIAGVSSLSGFTVMEGDRRHLLLAQKEACDVRMRVWNVTSGERRSDVVLTSGSGVFLSPDGKFGSVFKEDALRIYHLESGDLYAEVDYGSGSVSCTASAGKYFAFGFDQALGPAVVDVENGFLLHRFQYRSRSLAINDDLTYFACNSGDALAIHTFPLLERKAMIPLSAVAEKLLFSKEPGTVKKVYVMLGDRSLQAVSLQISKRKGSAQTLFQDIDLKDFTLSHNHDDLKILVRLSRSLYVLSVSASQKTQRRLQQLEDSSRSDCEHSTVFVDAGFSMNDQLIMAIRSTVLGVWNAISAQLIRELSFSEAPLVHLHTLETVNSALTVGSDSFVCLWNLDRLTTEREASANRVIRGEVRHIAVAAAADRYICAGRSDCVLAVGSLDSEKFQYFGDSSNEFENARTVEYIAISNEGNYAVIRTVKAGLDDVAENPSATVGQREMIVESEVVVWNLTGSCCRPIYRMEHAVDAVFSSHETKIAFTVALGKTLPDGKRSASEVVLFDLEKWKRGASPGNNLLESLHTEKTISKVVFSLDSSFLALACVQKQSSGENNNTYWLGVYSFEKCWVGLRFMNCTDLLIHCDSSKNTHGINETNNVVLVDVRAVEDAIVLITIDVVERLTAATSEKPLQNSHDALRRLAVFYDLRGDSVLSRIEPFLHPLSDVGSTVALQRGTTFVDNRCNVFKVENVGGGHQRTVVQQQRTVNVTKLDLDIRSSRDLCFVSDGGYAAAIVSDGAELVLVRTEDGREEGRLETHCRATVIAASADGRSVLVGCEDGRIMAFRVAFEGVDPVSHG